MSFLAKSGNLVKHIKTKFLYVYVIKYVNSVSILKLFSDSRFRGNDINDIKT
ncbi:hypothetical protein [Rickettsia sp. TH2014]|uniref:hypothetical protein n=1 Tax=Rickettsia sp. TH2014 TaxID=1967503 RepID=UPI001C4871CD|nr:hypothetical protein [Rickettsia sp. TH2014]